MRYLARILTIALIATAALWFGATYGPVQRVRADIYMTLSTRLANPDPAGPQINERRGVALLNSSKLNYHVFQSTKSIHDVLDDYEHAMVPADFHLFSRGSLAGASDVAMAVPDLPFLESLVNHTRVVRDETSTWGYLSYLDLGPEASQDWHAQFKKRMAAFSKSKRLGDLGTARTVVVVPALAGKAATVMSYWTDPDFNLSDFEDHGGDLPGVDVAGLPRIDPLRRIMSFDHVEDRLGFLLVMYETPLGPEQAIDLFDRKARGAGWGSRLWTDPQQHSRQVLFLRRGDAEVQIFSRSDHGKSYVMVSRRTVS